MTDEGSLARLCELAGLITSYRDAWNNVRHVPPPTQRSLLAAMGFDASRDERIAAATAMIEDAPWRRPLAPVFVTPRARGRGTRVPLTLPAESADRAVEWRLEKETGEARDGQTRFGDLELIGRRAVDGVAMERRALDLTVPIGLGYHALRVFDAVSIDGQAPSDGHRMPLIVVPVRCHAPPAAREQGGVWGVGLQLYGVRSARNWGIGDFRDLAILAGAAARLGADALGVNPLHAMFPDDPRRISPYSPSDRRFLNVLYIDVEAVADFADCPAAQALHRDPDFRRRLEAARAVPLVDYADASETKLRALDFVYQSFRARHLGGDPAAPPSERGAAFRRFQAASGEALRRFAAFQALSAHLGAGRPWREWPSGFRDPDSAEVAAFVERELERVEFYEYLQWQADQQLHAARRAAADGGMRIGLYHDLALAADAAGAESWVNQNLMARGVRVGAPPDEWNLRGQDWGLPAYNPLALRAVAYAPFIATVRSNMRHGGALRIDHVMALERMFWIPDGADPQDGGYVRYPVDDLIGILALESARQKCVVIGEDLGTLPEGFHDRLRSAGVLSYRLLYFAHGARGEVMAPSRFPAQSLVAIGTHDLATFPGFWCGRDLDVRRELGLFPSRESEAEARERRAGERAALVRAFKREGLLSAAFSEEGAFSFDLVQAAYRFLARSRARMLLVHAEDALGEVDQVNVPGTVGEHPNWRRKLPIDISAFASDPRLVALAAAIADERRKGARHRRRGEAR